MDCELFHAAMMVLKVLLRQRALDKPFHGGLGSFKLGALVAHYMADHLRATPSDLSELLTGFFEFCIRYDFRWGKIALRTGDRVFFGAGFGALQLRDAFESALVALQDAVLGTELSVLIAEGPLGKERGESRRLADS